VNAAAWFLIPVAAAVAFLGLALSGLVRTVDELRTRVAALETSQASIERPPSGLPVGTPAPAFEAKTPRGASFRSGSLAGHRHVIALADPGCEACERLVPQLLTAADEGELPPCVVVVTGTDPVAWVAPSDDEGRAVLVLDPGGAIADAFASSFTPHAFVIDEGGSIAARGPADDVPTVRRLLREAEGLQILRHEPVESLDG
jgi:redoxin